ncbi:MAG: hypothetical protein IJG08_01420 [Oscillospiraceae bacterium]|nr:hypothetical protein [Oscillospiraceae bacterium]
MLDYQNAYGILHGALCDAYELLELGKIGVAMDVLRLGADRAEQRLIGNVKSALLPLTDSVELHD